MTSSVSTRLFIGAFLTVTLFIGVQGHSYVTSPQSRSNQKQSESGCRGPACLGPCDVSLSARSASAAVHSASRGDQVTVQWPRNNHAGGFIRFAWAPTVQSDNASYFDERVQLISCHENGGCYPDDPTNPNGGDSGPADGSSRACSHNITIPADLTDGLWTLQWAWFGGAFSLGDYYSCVDYSISGGQSGPTPIPFFAGGDYTYPGQQKCKFFNTNELHVCVNEPCNNPIFPAAQEESGPPAYVQENFNSSVATAPSSPSTTGAMPIVVPPTPVPSTPSTTGAMHIATPLTTSKVQLPPAPLTTAAVMQPSTTIVIAPVPVSPPVTPSPSSSSCTSGFMKCLSDGTYSTCNHEAWGPSQACGTGLTCSPSGDYIYCIAGTISTPTPVPVAPVAPVPVAPVPTPSVTSTSTSSSSNSIASGSCTLGYQQCVSSNSYQTCGNGRSGPVWAGVQYCQTGLSCHASATANNIYCY